MSSSFSPTAEYTDSTTVLADGDAASAANLNAAPKKALDRAAYLRDATDGLLVWGGNARVDSSGTNNGNFKVYCPPIEAVSLLNGTTWNAYSLASETELTSSANFASGTLGNSTLYYVYAKVTASALAIEVSTTAPDAGNVWKSVATGTHRYLFAFFTSTSGVPLPQRRTRDGHTRYRTSAIGSTDLQALFAGAATSWADVALRTKGVPASARVATLETVMSSVSYTLSLRTKGDTASYRPMQVLTGQVEIETNSSGEIQYQASNASLSADLNVLGYAE